MEPINYLTQVADPFVQATQGLKLGSDITELQQKQSLIVQQQQQQQLAAQEQARFFAKPNPTMRDALQFASVLPKDRADALRPYIENFSKEQQQGVLKANGQILSALQVKPETGIKLLRDYGTAQRNSGDEAEASLYERIADAAADPERGPGMAFKSLVTVTARIPGAKEMFETIDKASTTAIAEADAPSKLKKSVADADKAVADAITAQATATNAPERAAADAAKAVADAQKAQVESKFAEQLTLADLKKKAADLGLTSAQTGSALAQTRKLNSEIAKAALELEVLKANGGVDPEKKFTQEEKIRKEWQGRSKMYSELQGTFNTLQASANSANGPGDIALITGFMKMLDPGSVVRETEFATARDTAGLFTQLQNRLEKAQNGQLLSPQQRREYVALSQKYLDSAQTKANQEKKDLGIVVKNYNLNPQNVFGAEVTGGGGGRGVVNPPTPGQTNVTVNY